MKYGILKLAGKIGVAEVAIENTRRNPHIMERIALYKYDEQRLQQGDLMLIRIKGITVRWNKAQSEKLLATNALHAVVKEAKTVYGKTRRIARVIFQNQEPQRRALALNGQSRRILSQWLEEARQFYTNALVDPEVIRQLSNYGITATRLAEEKNLLVEVEKAMANQEKKAAEAMEITGERKLAAKELVQWMSKFFTILRLAMGKSQMLEAVGIRVK
ncbi:MAG: hypothetical protein NT166_18730 [Candidatus Aminicenantes bacterium]|nr:hypothetical protein [Candidatus Aminicenantes bacterium]